MQFETLTPLGFSVGCTRAHWELIVNAKHPVLAGRTKEVEETLSVCLKSCWNK